MTRWLWLLLLLCCHCQELPELPAPPKELTWQDRLLDRLFTSLLTCLAILAWQRRSAPAAAPPPEVAGNVTQDLETFRQLSRRVKGDQKTVEEALSFVQALCEGLQAFEATSKVVNSEAGAKLVLRTQGGLFGEFATRSRIPFNVVTEEEVSFELSSQPPSGDCPFRCACHARCFGPASRSCEGRPLDTWAQVTVECGGQVLRLDAAAQVFAAQSFQDLAGRPVVVVPKNDVTAVNLDGAVAVLAEKHKPGTMSDGQLLRTAARAGASAVIKIGGGGAMLYSVPDPSEIPCFAISEDDGKQLLSQLRGPGRLREMTIQDQRQKLQKERWGHGKVWVYVSSIYLQSIDWHCPLSEVAEETQASRDALVYEDYFNIYQSVRTSDHRLSLEKSKLRRMMESAWSQLGRVGLTSNAGMMGKLLALGAQRCKLRLDYIKFQPAETFTGTACSMLLSPQPGFKQRPASDALVQAWVAHEAVYLALMGHFTKLIDYMAPSLWNFVKCINGEFFGWEADASKVRKLFSPCSGPVGPVPWEQWKQLDPTWRIVDERNALGMVVRTQGRLLWSKGATPAAKPREQRTPSGFMAFMGAMAKGICCC